MSPLSDSNPFSQPTLIEVADVSDVTFNSWRKRNGLFPRTNLDREWNSYSFAELIVARIVVGLSKGGMTAQKAVDIGMMLLPEFSVLSGWKPQKRITLGRFAIVRLVADGTLSLAIVEPSDIGLILDDAESSPAVCIDLWRTTIEVIDRAQKARSGSRKAATISGSWWSDFSGSVKKTFSFAAEDD